MAAFGLLQWALLVLLGFLSLINALGLVRSISQARATGLKYIILPFLPMSPVWLLLQPLLLPLFEKFPASWTEPWLSVLLVDRAWHNGHLPFQMVGSDTFITVSPGGCTLLSCDPKVNTQILRDGPFGKPTEMMQLLNAFGPALTASDGPEGRLYRRTAAPFFSETNMRQIWQISMQSSKHLVAALTGSQQSQRGLREVIAKYTINLLNQIAFDTEPDYEKELLFEEPVPSDHRMSYSEAALQSGGSLVAYFATPGWLLPYVNPTAYTAKQEFFKYLDGMKSRKRREKSERSVARRNPSMLDLLIDAHSETRTSNDIPFTEDAVNGNIFIMNLAGFESSANAMTFLLYVLACRPELQEAVYQDIKRVLGAETAEDWSYQKHFNPLMNSIVGAVIYETLRIFTVITVIPRQTARSGPVPLVVNGASHQLPPGMVCLLDIGATHRNPAYWPAAGSQSQAASSSGAGRESRPFPLSSFNANRWLVQTEDGPRLAEPEPGSFISFSEGSRGCLGRRFAIIEICAVMAVLLRGYRVKLLIREGSTEAEARNEAEWAVSGGVEFGHSLRPTTNVPIKFEAQ